MKRLPRCLFAFFVLIASSGNAVEIYIAINGSDTNPGTKDKPKGKLRLLYECNPLAFITEVAGGKATNGVQRILDVQPTSLHERSPLFIGSKGMMEELEKEILS